MNCKPGQLVMFVCADDPEDEILLGRIFTVSSIDPEWHIPAWLYEGSRQFDSFGDEVIAFADECLKPIEASPGNESWFKSAPLERAKPAEVEA